MAAPRILVIDRTDGFPDALRVAVADLEPQPSVELCTRIGAIAELLTANGPYDVLVAGPSMGTKAGLARLEIIHDELPLMPIVLGFSRRPTATLREIVRTGAMDLVHLPANEDELRTVIERALMVAQAAREATPSDAHSRASSLAPAPTPAPPTSGIVLTTSSATGGCGKTFLATNLAYFLQHNTGKRVCIIDLDLQFGEVTTALRMRPRYTVFDALQRDDGEDGALADHIEEYMLEHGGGFSVLSAPKDPSEADHIDPSEITKVIEAARTRFDFVIVDTPAALTEVVLTAFDLSDVLFVMATLDLPSVRNMGVFLNTLDRLKIPSDNVRLLLNKAERDVGIDVEQVTRLFPKQFSAVLPYAKEVSRSINLGVPVMESSPEAEVSRLLAAGMLEFLPEDARARAIAAARKPRGGGLLRRRSGR